MINDKKKLKSNKDKSNVRKCFRCGSDKHLAHQCNHKETICNFCKGKGHLRRVCFKASRQLNQIEEVESDSEQMLVEDILQIYESEVKSIVDPKTIKNRAKIFYNLQVNTKMIRFEIDTGAPVSIISAEVAKINFPKEKVYSSDTELYSYCGNPLDIVGYILVSVKSSEKSPPVKLYIVRSRRNALLGREWLRVVKLDWSKIIEGNLKETNLVNTIAVDQVKTEIKKVTEKYSEVFSSTMGKITGYQARLHLKEGATPKFFKARKVPFSLIHLVEDELERQVQDGLLERVSTSEWATPVVVVPKKNKQVRLCGDYKITINPVLNIDEYPLPTVDELFSTMAGGDKFTKLDLSQAYLQLEVHSSDRHLLTLNTHKGLYRPTRLMFGVASAPAKFQQFMEQLLNGIPGVSVFLDDIRITAENDVEHVKRVDEVLKRLSKANMRINLDKCEWMQDEIEYCGFVISKDGIKKTKGKMEALDKMKRPTNKDEARAVVGLINYYGRFVKNLSSILYPINRLLSKNVRFKWCSECEAAFMKIKEIMQSDIVLVFYDPQLPLVLAVDASPYGVGAILSHIYEDGTEKPIHFASQTLSKVQQKYSQIDKEAYAIIFGVRKFYQYLYGRKFTLVTDNKPLSKIFAPNKGLPLLSASRMQHYAIFLSSFNYEIKVKKSNENANADAFSRLPGTYSGNRCDEVDLIETEWLNDLPVTFEVLKKETEKDNVIKILIESLKHGRECDAVHRFNIHQSEFTLQQGCLLRGIRVYIPKKLRYKVLEELHAGHFGAPKMKALARGYCWWPKMDSVIENLVKNCAACQSVRPDPPKTSPVHVWSTPTKVFERVHADFAGPILGKYLFVLVDAYSKWPEVYVINNITAETTIHICREIFSRLGAPNVFVSDHGTQFKSADFQKFLENNGIKHKVGAPYHPSTNGLAERFVRTIKEKLKAVNCTPTNLGTEVNKILFAYRRAVHPTTGRSPAMLMLGRQIQSRLDLIVPRNTILSCERTIPKKQFAEGERVMAREYLHSEKWRLGRIIRKTGDLHYDIELDDQRIWKRHVDQMRRVGEESITLPDTDINIPTDHSKVDHNAANNSMPISSDNAGSEINTDRNDEITSNRPSETNCSRNRPSETNRSGNEDFIQPAEADNKVAEPQVVRRSKRHIKAPDRLDL